MFVTCSAWAEWILLGDNPQGDQYYLDDQSIRINGKLRFVWEHINLQARGKDGELSQRMRVEYDCAQERYRWTTFSRHSGPKVSGDILFSHTWDEPGRWREIPPRSVVEAKLKFVCAS
jgi:hypothetical protein